MDDENGVLISTILRQYFLSLKVIGKWSRGGFYRNFFDPMKKDMSAKGRLVRSPEAAKHEELDDDNEASGSESENDGFESDGGDGPEVTRADRTLNIAKKMGTMWARLAGVEVSGQDGRDLNVDWTSAISPAVEGRIVDVKKE